MENQKEKPVKAWQRGSRRNKKKFSACEILDAHEEYFYSPVNWEQERKIDLWLKNLISFEECFSKVPIEMVLA